MTKKIYKIEGMHCTSCALLIESDLEDVGVKCKCSYAKQILVAEFDEKKISEKNIAEVVKNAGYTLAR